MKSVNVDFGGKPMLLYEQNVEDLYSKEEAQEKGVYLDKDTGMWTNVNFCWTYLEPDVRKVREHLWEIGRLNEAGIEFPEYMPAEEKEEVPEPVVVKEDVRDQTAVLAGVDDRTKEQAWMDKVRSEKAAKPEVNLEELAMLLKCVIKDIAQIKTKLNM